jgi:hypothetical protein
MAGTTVIVPKVAGYVAYDPTGVAITGTQSTGIPVLLAQSWVAVSAPADTTEDTLATIAIPAGTFGSNGCLRILTFWTVTNNVNVKTARLRFSGASGTQYTNINLASNATFQCMTIIANRGATNSQVGSGSGQPVGGFGTTGAANVTTSAVDTTAATTLVITAQKATAGDTMTLEGYLVEYIKASNA